MTAVTIFLLEALIFATAICPLLEASELWPFASVFYVLWASAAMSGLLTMGIDPADPSFESDCQDSNGFYCRHCQSTVRSRSKHCRDCNKCVDSFDHHCIWLNTCIGSRNYKAFFAIISLVLLMLGVIVVSASILLARELHGTRRPHVAMALLVTLGLNVPLWLLDAAFLGLHCFLCARGLTTYEFMRGMQKAPSRQQSANQDNIQGGTRAVQLADVRPVQTRPTPATLLSNTAAAHCSQLLEEECSGASNLEDSNDSESIPQPASPLTSTYFVGSASRTLGWLIQGVASPSREGKTMKDLSKASSWVLPMQRRPLRLRPQHGWSPLLPARHSREEQLQDDARRQEDHLRV